MCPIAGHNEREFVMIYNHWGITVDSGKPITGVISCNSAEWLSEESQNGIDLGYEQYIEQARSEHEHYPRRGFGEGGPGCNCEDSTECSCGGCETCDSLGEDYDDCGDGTYLIGSWKTADDGKYEPDTSGEYAAIYRAGSNVTQVVWSKFASRAALCSPCYPGQANLDTAGRYLAYALPPDMFGTDDEHLDIVRLDEMPGSQIEIPLEA